MKFLSVSLLLVTVSGNLFDTVPKDVTRRLEDDMTWMNGYSVLYENCFHDGNLALFRLCPENSKCEAGCSGGGEYVLDLNSFIDAFSEAQMGAHEYRCEMARENCDYDDDALCYSSAGLSDCDDRNQDKDGFNLQEFTECNKFDDTYYVGPYCSENNFGIYLGLFTDEDCTAQVSKDLFYDTYGYVLPYSNTAIIANECANCREHAAEQDQNGGDDADDEDNVIEQCEELYYTSAKCEENLDIEYADTSSCSLISSLKKGESVTVGKASKLYSSTTSMGPVVLTLLLCLMLLGCCCVGWCFFPKPRKGAQLDLDESKTAALM